MTGRAVFEYTTILNDTFWNNVSTNLTTQSTHVFPQALWLTVILGFLAGAVSLTTILGNITVLLAFVLEPTIRQPANYFLASLAVSDLLIGTFSMPLYTQYLLLGKWSLGEIICDLWLSLDWTVCLVAQYSVLLITLDRFFSVKFPAKYRKWRTGRKVLVMISVIWILPAIVFFTSVIGWQYFIDKRTRAPEVCEVQFLSDPMFIFILTIGYYWTTLFFMCALYGGIFKVALDLHSKSHAKHKRMLLIYELMEAKRTAATSEASKEGDKEFNSCKDITGQISLTHDAEIRNKNVNRYSLKSRLSCAVQTSRIKRTSFRIMKLVDDDEKFNNFAPNKHTDNNDDEIIHSELLTTMTTSNSLSGLVDSVTSNNTRSTDCSDANFSSNVKSQASHVNCLASYINGQAPHVSGQASRIHGQASQVDGQASYFSGQASQEVNSRTSHVNWLASHLNCQASPISGRAPHASGQMSHVKDQMSHVSGQAPLVNGQSSSVNGHVSDVSGQASHVSDQVSHVNCKSSDVNGQMSDVSGQASQARNISSALIDVQNGTGNDAEHANSDKGDEHKNSIAYTKASLNYVQTIETISCLQSPLKTTVIHSNVRLHKLVPVVKLVQSRNKMKSKIHFENRACKALRTISVILGTFITCWTPYHVAVMLIAICGNCVNEHFYAFSYWMCYVISPINPFCYAYANNQFKKTFLRIMKFDWHTT